MMAIPPLGLGTWPLTGPEATRAVLSGIEAGYRLIDTAAIYGNEDAVGAALAKCGLPRDELFVTTKLRGSDHLSGDIRGAVERSLKTLGLDRLDLFLIHWPLPRHDKYVPAFEAMLACRDAGLVRHVGVSNFLGTHLRRVVAETGQAPAVNQIQMDPSLARLQVVLAWHRVQGAVPIVRSADPARQAENLAALDGRLTAGDVDALTRLDRGESAARDVETEEHF